MSKFDLDYIALCKKILAEGQHVPTRTGTSARKIFGHTFRFDLAEEFPILTTKFVAWKSAIIEMLWIYQQQSNDVNWLKDRGVRIWNEWGCDENGDYFVDGVLQKSLGKEFANTIGTAYGWIVKHFKMTQRIIETLKTNPMDRRMVMSLWQDEFVPTATLPSCVWNSQWNVTNGKLNVVVSQRSCDVALGLPFNVSQYAVLLHLLAHTCNLEAGELLWVINDAHIYENQIDGISEQIAKFEEMGHHPSPKLWINPDVTDFFAFDSSRELKDIKLVDYKYNVKISMPVSI